jgi:hypothetical protein
VRNVRIGLATDGFSSFNLSVLSYSCCHVFAIPYNLPPAFSMKYEFSFSCLVIPSSNHFGTKINVMMRPLVEDLKLLWEGVKAYNCYKK